MTQDPSIDVYGQRLLTFMESNCAASFDLLAVELFEWHLRFNPAYTRFCERQGLLKIDHWRQIPALPTAAFKELEVTWLAPSERSTIFHSSGTTQVKPSRHYHSADTLAIYEASLWHWFKAHLTPASLPTCRLLALTPPREQAPHSSLVHMFATLEDHLGQAIFCAAPDADGVWQLDIVRTEAALSEACATNSPILILGPAFAYVQLMAGLGARRFQLPAGSRAMETGGYKGRTRARSKEELRNQISQQFGLAPAFIVGEYGMSELSSQAYDHRAGKPGSTFHFPPWARVLIISPETGQEVAEGELGLIRVVDLANVSSTPAVQTEDLGIRRGEGFEWIGRVGAADPRGCSLMFDDGNGAERA